MTMGSTAGASHDVHDPQGARTAGSDWLSLALMDSRNRTLHWLSAFEAAHKLLGGEGGAAVPLHLVGRAGWWQEFWIARNPQRARGEAGTATSLRLASILPRADEWFGGAHGWSTADASTEMPAGLPSANDVRSYLAATLDATLELLAGTDGSHAALHLYRVALLREDRLAEALAVAAQWLQVAPGDAAAPGSAALARAQRAPLWLPACRFTLGSPPGGLVPPAERWAHEVSVPDFEIDAQAVSWARFVEFAEDGGYDEPRFWSPEGWAHVQAQGRRAPRGVEQLRGGVLLQRGPALHRAPGGQPAVHVNWYEADAWCRWAGRRLPTEVEWELAACTAAPRGFVWGDVLEWAAGSARAWPSGGAAVGGFAQPLSTALAAAPPASIKAPQRVLRGASSWATPRAVHPKARRFAPPERDDIFAGFRSCAP